MHVCNIGITYLTHISNIPIQSAGIHNIQKEKYAVQVHVYLYTFRLRDY